MKPNLLILDDNEGELAAAPAVAKLEKLANVTIMNRPIGPEDHADLAKYHTIFACVNVLKSMQAFSNCFLILN